MNLTRLFAMQKVLDKRIEKEHQSVEGEERLPKKILALLVELGECANEWRGFKFWSKDQEPKINVFTVVEIVKSENGLFHEIPGYKNPLLEEYVDCLHFFLSIGLDLKNTNPHIYSFKEEWTKEKTVLDSFMTVFEHVRELDMPLRDYDLAFSRFIELGKLLGFTWEQIEQAYISKNEVNHERQNAGY